MKKTINNMLMAFVAILALTLSSCAQSDNSQSEQSPVVGQWESTSEEGWNFHEDGETVKTYYIYQNDNTVMVWNYDELGELIEKETIEEVFEPNVLNIKSNGTLSLSTRAGEMACDYYLKGNRIVLPDWGDEVIWNYSIEDGQMVIEEQNYYKGVLDSYIITSYQRK